MYMETLYQAVVVLQVRMYIGLVAMFVQKI